MHVHVRFGLVHRNGPKTEIELEAHGSIGNLKKQKKNLKKVFE